jgi:hypothetical protein
MSNDEKRQRGDTSFACHKNSHRNKTQEKVGTDTPQSKFAILQLPDAALSRVFSFLPLKIRVSFAMSLPVWKNEQTHNVIKTIIATERMESIDFLDLGYELASVLTDDDLKRILESVNAATNLKSLKLTHCLKIKSDGLAPLRGSQVLERIDLSRNGECRSSLISPDAVLPILLSIVDGEGCSLRHIQLPYAVKWYRELQQHRSHRRELRRFVRAYNRLSIECVNCGVDDSDRGFDCPYYDVNSTSETRTCYDCTNHYCHGCNLEQPLKQCGFCERRTCDNCDSIRKCRYCNGLLCRKCGEFYLGCTDCGPICGDCTKKCERCKTMGCNCVIYDCNCVIYDYLCGNCDRVYRYESRFVFL